LVLLLFLPLLILAQFHLLFLPMPLLCRHVLLLLLHNS